MSDKKECNKCHQTKCLNEFDEGKLCFKKCNEYRKVHREKHKDRYNDEQRKRYEEDEEYRKRKQGQRRLFESKVVFCSVCSKSMSQKYYYDHMKTKKRNNNLKNK